MRSLALVPAGLVALVAVACSSTAPSEGAGESDLTASKGFAYDCTASSTILEDADELLVEVTPTRLRFTDGYGPNLGAMDSKYRPRGGADRVRYDGFGFGGDCSLDIIADRTALAGAETTTVRVQCRSYEEFYQDIYTCKNPRPVTIAEPAPAPPPDPTPAADARTWSCKGDIGALGDDVKLQLDEKSIRVEGDHEHLGLREEAVAGKLAYSLEFGGDCSLTATVATSALEATAKEIELSLSCEGPDAFTDVYTCK